MKNNNWIYKVFLLAFILSVLFSTITNLIAYHAHEIFIFAILIIVICIGILFDMIGTSVLTSKESTFHSMNSKKISGAKEAIYLIKNNVKIANLCNDVIGDICGIVSGGLGAVLAISICQNSTMSLTVISIILAAFISSFTVGGKAIFKTVAVNKSDNIIFFVSKITKTLKFK